MNQTLTKQPVLTLAEAARFLRVKKAVLQKLVEEGRIPARKVGEEWRFFRGALESRLAGDKDFRSALLQQVGAYADDETLPELRKSIYEVRGRPEVEPED
jgi:excisionase family DNA binding protein